ncbi:DUF6686 family protein [Chitinophaga vietnamensis]|uniref:DUF6686 family protein n=1 Tax=Chitinophaga vietnamensis TaxID=2593957 RepID=UPI00117754C9|nr:DUF6686 family protein [Chitinophaga vietnamensis]
MCNYQTLYHGSNGYVIRCPRCRNMQLAFGTTAVNLSSSEFDYFAKMMARMASDVYPESVQEKIMCVPLPAEQVMMLLTPAEVAAIAQITTEVQVLLEAYEILETPLP